jgi:hypothetical protein
MVVKNKFVQFCPFLAMNNYDLISFMNFELKFKASILPILKFFCCCRSPSDKLKIITVMKEGVWLFLIFNLSCNVSSLNNQSFADARSSNIKTTTTYAYGLSGTLTKILSICLLV